MSNELDKRIREAAIHGIKAIGLQSSTAGQKRTLSTGIRRAFGTASMNALAKRLGMSQHAPPADFVDRIVETTQGRALLESLEKLLRKHHDYRSEQGEIDFSKPAEKKKEGEAVSGLKSRFSTQCNELFGTRQPVTKIHNAAIKHMFG